MNPQVRRWFLITEIELVRALVVLGVITRSFCGGKIRWSLLAMEVGLSIVLTPMLILLIQRAGKDSAWYRSAILVVVVLSYLLRELFVPDMVPGVLGLLTMFAFAIILMVPITWVRVKTGPRAMKGNRRGDCRRSPGGAVADPGHPRGLAEAGSALTQLAGVTSTVIASGK